MAAEFGEEPSQRERSWPVPSCERGTPLKSKVQRRRECREEQRWEVCWVCWAMAADLHGPGLRRANSLIISLGTQLL